jgi:hypothetical protein
LLLALIVSGCGAGEPAAPPEPPQERWFEDATAEAGVELVHVYAVEQRFWMPEISSGGLAFFDYDSDGALDLYLVQSGGLADGETQIYRNQLFRNIGGGKFEEVPGAAGADDDGYGHGCAVGDVDADGDQDLFIANLRDDRFYRNDDGSFVDATEASGLGWGEWSTSSAFLDIDGDGDLDLYATNNLRWDPERHVQCASHGRGQDYCSPKNFDSPSTDRLYINDGTGVFVHAAERGGVLAKSGIGLGVAPADYDGDGDVDIYVANDSVPNHLWVNDGSGSFKEEALTRGCAVNGSGLAEAGMGVHAADIDADGDWDLFMTHIHNETNTYYRNKGGVFSDRTSLTGLSQPSMGMTGWGIGFHDFDNDSWLDVFIGNGRVEMHEPLPPGDDIYAEVNQLFRGAANGFVEISGALPDIPLGSTRAAAFGDYDSDGDVDIAYLDRGATVRLLKNVAPKAGAWIGFKLLNQHGSPSLGAEVRVRVGEKILLRQCQPAYSYCSSSDPSVLIGLGELSAVSEAVVRWPGGMEEVFGPMEAGSYHALREGAGRPR